ncbi:Bug family tripartite tricarboxylate transporter substrate binding protein [Cupriavidus taiwanensis]|uniref:Bug family tripartite tricarboxylate transporter substrate binding protein n=1 Tax=Cupriavidus taiwanensis TaxID=164546 RepID=UPI000E1298C1|nr:tripartite tricarboxylate transporter substrate binding protein [Cupriavidus taiwanensis]SPA52219.1 Extra-cytoplasmic solute receptor [Cupriavidus taiwanensis]
MIRMSRRQVLGFIGGIATAATILPASWAQAFPTKPVTLAVPYTPGGASDVMARALAARMADDLGQPVIVENLGGATGAIAAQRVLNKPADGLQVYVGSSNELILGPLATSSPRFKSEDFQMVGKVGDLTLAILSRGSLPPNNIKELIEYAALRAREGNPLTYGSVGPGSLYHLLGEKFSQLTGAPMVHVPYKGGTPLTTDLIGGQIDLYLGAMGATSTPLVTNGSGKLKLLAIISPERLDLFRNIPAASHTTSLKDFSYSLWLGLFVKKGTPENIVQALNRAMNKSLSDPVVKKAADSLQVVLAQPQSQAQAEQLYAASTARYRAVFQSIGFRP